VDFPQDIPFIVNFLPKTNRIFQRINLLQVKCSPTEPTCNFQSINPPTRIGFFPRMEFRLVLFSICQINYASRFFTRHQLPQVTLEQCQRRDRRTRHAGAAPARRRIATRHSPKFLKYQELLPDPSDLRSIRIKRQISDPECPAAHERTLFSTAFSQPSSSGMGNCLQPTLMPLGF